MEPHAVRLPRHKWQGLSFILSRLLGKERRKGKLPKAVVEVSINLRSKNLIDYVNKMTMNFNASYEQNR
jgi:hypothetical protein